MFLGAVKISTNVFTSNLYTQYHCFPRILIVNKPPSFCHSIILSKKFALLKILAHQETGITPINKSPHFPCGFNVVAKRGRNFNVRKRTKRKTTK